MNKEQKHVLKKVDNIIEAIKNDIPDDFTPAQVSAVFTLYISLYE